LAGAGLLDGGRPLGRLLGVDAGLLPALLTLLPCGLLLTLVEHGGPSKFLTAREP
jgi:hypothetical protein